MTAAALPSRLVLFYKHLTEAGGAERLIANEFRYFCELGLDVYLAANALDRSALFGVDVPEERTLVLNAPARRVPRALAQTLRSLGNPPVLCSSGHIDVYLASLMTKAPYALHIHHPNYMSFNDFDKYSIFLRGDFDAFCDSNFGAARFRETKKNLSARDLARVNARAALSVLAHRRARAIFVLSQYAQREKKALYGVDTLVRMGALDDGFETRLRACFALRKNRPGVAVPRVLTLARLDRNKRIDELIRAIAWLNGRGRAVMLDVVGRGSERVALERLAALAGVADNVVFHGYVNDTALNELLIAANVFVSIDWADYKLTLFEALSHGVPALVSEETEVDPRLAATGQVSVAKPEPETVADRLETMLARPPALDVDALAEILRDYAWRAYFERLVADLVKARLIVAPSSLMAGGVSGAAA